MNYYCDKFFWENPFSEEQIRKINEIADEAVSKVKKVSFSEDEKTIYLFYQTCLLNEDRTLTNDMKNLILKKLGKRLADKKLSRDVLRYLECSELPSDFYDEFADNEDFVNFVEFKKDLDKKSFVDIRDFLDNYEVFYDVFCNEWEYEGSLILDIMNDEYYLGSSIDIDVDDIEANEEDVDIDELDRIAMVVYRTKVLAYFFGAESEFFQKAVLNEKGEICDWKYEVL